MELFKFVLIYLKRTNANQQRAANEKKNKIRINGAHTRTLSIGEARHENSAALRVEYECAALHAGRKHHRHRAQVKYYYFIVRSQSVCVFYIYFGEYGKCARVRVYVCVRGKLSLQTSQEFRVFVNEWKNTQTTTTVTHCQHHHRKINISLRD